MNTPKNSVTELNDGEAAAAEGWMIIMRVPAGDSDPVGRGRLDALLQAAREMGCTVERACHLTNRVDTPRPPKRDLRRLAEDLRRRSEQSRMQSSQMIKRLKAQLRNRARQDQQ